MCNEGILHCFVCVSEFFLTRDCHIFVVLVVVAIYAVNIRTGFLVFCSLFPLTNSLPRLLAGGYDHFLALRVFGLSFLCVLRIFEVSLVPLFLLLPVWHVYMPT